MLTQRSFVLALLTSLLGACGGSTPPPATTPPPEETASAPSRTGLSVDVITSSPEGFLVTSTLVSGANDAILIDAQFTLADAQAVATRIQAAKKRLTTVYVTHSHPDHYFGFPALSAVFPDAKLVALPATVAGIERTWKGKVEAWKPLYKDAITDQPIIPEPLSGNYLELEGEKLEIVGGLQGDDADNTYVWIPSLSTVVAGDIIYDQVFPWTAETTPEDRAAWSATLDKIAQLGAKTVVPGHQKPEQSQDASNIQFTQAYLKAYDEALQSSKTPEELQAKIKARYPDVALDVVLKLGAEASLKPAGKTAKK